ncbi:MAG TPA: glycosyltransferase family 2 protein [Flavisolibacter sp.]|nr:glycosyltransferase family 2 protein [Flavisolibacter sp.]
MADRKNPLVSVVLPFYNEEAFLAETVESVLAQTYPTLELLLVDDNGSVQCTQMAKAYAAQWPGKVLYVEHEGHANKGPAASRNLGIQRAQGELVAFVDADDVWLPNKIEEQVRIFQSHSEVAMVVEASRYWFSWENPDQQDKIIPVGAPANQLFAPPALALQLYPLASGDAPCPSSIVMTKAALQRIGGFEESFVGFCQAYEDQAFLSKIYLQEVVYVSGSCHNLYRQRKGSAMHRMLAGGNYEKARYHFLNWLKNYMETKGYHHPEVEKLLRTALQQSRRVSGASFYYKVYNQLARIKQFLFSTKAKTKLT